MMCAFDDDVVGRFWSSFLGGACAMISIYVLSWVSLCRKKKELLRLVPIIMNDASVFAVNHDAFASTKE